MHATYVGMDNENEIFRRAAQNEIPSTIEKVLSKHWDIIVLQEATWNTLNPGIRYYSTEPAIKRLDSTIKRVSGKTVLYQGFADQIYQGYGEQKFPKKNCIFIEPFFFPSEPFVFDPNQELKVTGKDTTFCTDSFNNSAEEFHALEIEYNKLATKINADVVEIGLAFEMCKKKYPEIKLYYSLDDNHPSKQGAYLIACMFFKYLTGQNLEPIKYHGAVNENEAKKSANWRIQSTLRLAHLK